MQDGQSTPRSGYHGPVDRLRSVAQVAKFSDFLSGGLTGSCAAGGWGAAPARRICKHRASLFDRAQLGHQHVAVIRNISDDGLGSLRDNRCGMAKSSQV